jgi:hypothetical protein
MANISPDAQAVLTQAGEGAQQYVLNKGGFGNNLTSGEATSLLSGFQAAPNVGQQVQSGIAQLGSQQYQFDPNQYLPGIQNTANSIYSPQQAQLEAIRQLQQASASDTKIQTEKDFAKRLQQETEAINRRGAFFSGGAIQNEQDIRSQQASAIYQQDLQSSAAQYGNYAQQAQLAAEKTQFIQDKLTGAENSAYSRWTDQRNFSLQALTTQYQVYSQERAFTRSIFESDRSYNMDVTKLDMAEKQFKQQYAMDDKQFKMAQEKFNLDMKVGNLSYDQALAKFKKESANINYGVLGADANGKDQLEVYRTQYNGQTKIDIPAGNSVTGSDSSFNVDSFITGQ